MHEQVVNFGNDAADLIGIYNQAATRSSTKPPVVVMWNVGVSHRVGAQRQFVDLARRLCTLSFSSFRFDIGGLGDSQAASAGNSRRAQELADIAAALDVLSERYGHDRFILVGFCSSSGTAHSAALADPRVVGLIVIDGYGYSTPMHRVRHTLSRVFSPRNIASRAGRITRSVLGSGDNGPSYFSSFPPREEVETQIATMAERGMRFLYVYSGGVQIFFNHAQQFWRMFPTLGRYADRITVRYFPDANHLFMYRSNRSTLLDCLQDWVLDQFSLAAIGPRKASQPALPQGDVHQSIKAAVTSAFPATRDQAQPDSATRQPLHHA